MKNNKLYLLFLLLLFGLYTSCDESRLDQQPLTPTEASYFTEEIDYERGILAVYAKLSDIYWFNANNPIHGFWQLPGDDITTSGTEGFEIFSNLNSANGAVNTYYTVAYQLINRANTMLEKIDNAPNGVYKTANLKEYHRGEALFLRGYMYFQLWNYFGTSPLITKRIQTAAETNNPSSTGTQLLDQAILDFTQAADLLPTTWNDFNRGRANKNSANGFLGKSLVFRGDHNKANADYVAAIAAFNKLSGLSLVANFGDNFASDTENNAESLFEFQASQPAGDNVWLNNDFDNNIGSMSAYWGWYENHWSLFGKPHYVATQKLQNAFEVGDPRKEITFVGADIKKYVNRSQKTQSGVATVNNPRILRYADILLLKAEAILSSGGSKSEAIALINQVRKRARDMNAGAIPADRNIAETANNTIQQWIMDERFIELAGEEGIRWLDLKRWHAAGKINLAGFDFSSARNDVAFALPKHLLFPIPLSEIDLNPSVKQNSGY
jgi:hypothetical protein